jgi:hypothetical protein
VTYAFIVEWMDAESRKEFDSSLPRAPVPQATRASAPSTSSQGTEGLMAAFQMQR